MKKAIMATALVAVVLMSSGCAGKFRGGDMSSHMFNKYEQNDDNLVTQKAYTDVAVSRFERTDANDDSKITRQESQESRFGKFMPGIMESWFERNDINSDEIVERSEMLTTTSNDFVLSDTNKDNLLSQDEMKVHRKNLMFDSIDANNDDVITRDEFQNSKSPFEKK